MKIIYMMLFTLTLLFSEGISQKLIVYSDKNAHNAQESLSKLKVHFIENPNLRALSETNDLKLELERLGAYTMVVVKPVVSLSVKKSLLIELIPVFPDVFALKETKQKKVYNNSQNVIPEKSDVLPSNTVGTYIEIIGLQWIALLILSVVGLLLSILRRNKLHILDRKQQALDIDQKDIEQEIKNLGKHNA